MFPTPMNVRPDRRGFSSLGLAWCVACVTAAAWLISSGLRTSPEPQPPSASALPAMAAAARSHPHTKNIEDVKAGERVWSYDIRTGSWAAKPVVKPLVHDYDGDFVTLSVAGATVPSTGNHPYWVVRGRGLFDRHQAADVPATDLAAAVATGNGRWVAARDVEAGDLLVLRDGRLAPVDEVRVTSRAAQKVYNIQVADLHTYAVGEVGVAVHNKPCFPPGTLVLMVDGTTKPIECIELGDTVLAVDPRRTDTVPSGHAVVGLTRDFAPALVHVLVETVVGGEAALTATRHHPCWTSNRGWVYAYDLRQGDLLRDERGHPRGVVGVVTDAGLSRTYNLSVDGVHTFYALASDGTPLLVHNTPIVTPIPERGFVHVEEPGQGFLFGSLTDPSTFHVDLVSVDPAFQGQGVGASLYKAALDQFPNVTRVTGEAAWDNSKALKATGDINQTPRAKILSKLGFTDHSYDPQTNKMTSSKPNPLSD